MRLDHKRLAIAVGILLGGGALVTCAQQPTALDTELFPIAAVLGSDAPAGRPSGRARPDAEPLLLTPVPQTDENCLDCHTDVESLQELATEAEPTEAPSSGEG